METMTGEDVKAMMADLLETAKQNREAYKYSEDEKMVPCAMIYGSEGIAMIALLWRDNKEKYLMAAGVNAKAREMNAKSLSFVTDSRWVKSDDFAKYFKMEPPIPETMEDFVREYHRILRQHGGEIKNLPRAVWQEAVVVFTNGPGIPTQIQMAPYKEGPNDTIEWLPRDREMEAKSGRSDMLTDWWA